MLTTTTISPAMASAAPSNAVRPLGDISDIACSDRIGGTIYCISLQETEFRPESARAIVDGLHMKIGKIDREALADLSEREKRVAALDLRVVIHGLRELCKVADIPLNNGIQDIASAIIHEDLDGGHASARAYQDSLDLGLQELLHNSPSKDPRGYTQDMRTDVAAACTRSIAFVIDDMRGGFAYQGLQPFVNMTELTKREPVSAATPRRSGW